ncbi:MAG TPA: ABC transporter permease, partial [Cytophagaceae bacterium]
MSSSNTSLLKQLNWYFRMAWRDGYASRKKLFLFISSIVLGIAAVVAIQLFGFSLKENIRSQSKGLLGADFVIDTREPASGKVKAIIDSLPGEKAIAVKFSSMVTFPSSGNTRMVNIKAIEGAFPFYGEFISVPASAKYTYQKEGKVLIDETLMLQYSLQAGDSIKVGKVTFVIAGIITKAPGATGVSASIAPPVFIPYSKLAETGLLQKGSRIEYEYYFKTDSEVNVERIDKLLDPILENENASITTHASAGKRMTRSYDNFAKFLNIVAFTALLLGCIGVASSINLYIREKLNNVAILQSLGATRMQAFLIYLLQIAGIGLAGSIIGTGLGMGLQKVFPLLVQDFIPIEIQLSFSISIIAMGILLGLLMSVLFALLPLMNIWNVSPLAVLRVSEDNTSGISNKRKWIISFIILLSIFLFSYWQLNDIKYAGLFTAGIIIVFAFLTGIGILLMYLVKRFFPHSLNFSIRQSLLNLYRPNNQTLILIVSIGIGSFLISTLYMTKDILLNKVGIESGYNDPNMIVYDIQSEQLSRLKNELHNMNYPVLQEVPIVTMRLHSLKGKETEKWRADTITRIRDWVLNREYRVTFRDTLTDAETVIHGKWTGHADPSKGVVEISIDKGLAEDMKVSIGDELEFNVQGVIMKTKVGSIREVDWRRLQTNFLVVFPKGILENAPQFHVVTTKVPDNIASAKLQQVLIDKFPNVTIIDLRQVLSLVGDIVNKISNVISFMAFFSIVTGIIVLIGAVATSKYQRIKEAVLLRTLGA